jgi:hypothetical protein
LSPAHAADPAFCKQYAQAALNQVRGGFANPGCVGGLQGAHWLSDFAVHYEWCLGASFGAAGAERDARKRVLRSCTRRWFRRCVTLPENGQPMFGKSGLCWLQAGVKFPVPLVRE